MGVRSQMRVALRRPEGMAVLATLVALAVLLPAWWLADEWYAGRLLAQERASTALETTLRGSTLSSIVNRKLARLQALYAYVQVELPEEDWALQFPGFAAGLSAGAQGIHALTVAPGGIVRHVYPLAGNENLVGLDVADDPRGEVRLGVERAIDSGEVVLTGPLESAQGGQGLIALQSVRRDGAYWGLVSMELDLQTILHQAGLDEQLGSLDFALRSGQEVFGGPEKVFASNPVLAAIRFPEDEWELAAVPARGWGAGITGPLRVFQVSGLTIAGLLAGLVFLTVSRQARLAQAVRQRTQEIAAANVQLQQDVAERRRAEAALTEREAQYRSIFESTGDGLLIYDLEGKLVDCNPAAARMHGWSVEEFRRLEPSQFIDSGSLPLLKQLLETVQSGGEFHSRARNLRRDRGPFDVEEVGTGFVYKGELHALAVVRDVTEEVETFEVLERRVEERTRELSMLLDASANITSTLDLPLLLELILEQLEQIVEYDGASVWMLQGDELRSVAHRGSILRQVQSPSRLGREQVGELWEALEEHSPLIIGDVREDTRLAQAFRRALGEYLGQELSYVRTWIGFPLMVQERLIGWLSLYHGEPNSYARHQVTLAQTIANQAATAIENAQLYGQARRLAVLEERQRLARELHDSVSQVLYGVGLGARTARSLLDRSAITPDQRSGLAEPLDYVLSLAEVGLAEMRALIFELRPDSLEREGVVTALSRQVDATRVRLKLDARTEFCDEPALALEAKEALYRIAQEALSNVAKHAQASRVDLRLRYDDGGIALEMQDDGVGFDPQREYPGHMGLRSMRERAAGLGGALEIQSSPGHGTRLRVWIPLCETPEGSETGQPLVRATQNRQD